jgi:carboxylesterase
MLNYLLGLGALFAAYRKLNLFLIKRMLNDEKKEHLIPGAEPFFLQGKKNIGVLLIHGFTATSNEMKELGKYLNNKGLTVYSPLLSGHGTTPGHLLKFKSEDWLIDVKKSIKLLEKNCNEIYLVGNSFGGNLVFLNANESSKIKGIVSLAAPFVFKNQNLRKGILYAFRQFKVFQRKRPTKKVKEIYRKTKRISYQQIPLNSLLELQKIVNLSRGFLSKINKKVLIIQSTQDNIVSEESVNFIYNKVKSKNKEIFWVKNSIHVLVADDKKIKIFKKICSFISG